MTIFTTNEWSRTAPDRAIAALFVYEGLVWVQTLLIVKKVTILPLTLVSLAFGRLSGLGTSGWRGALSAEGLKSSI